MTSEWLVSLTLRPPGKGTRTKSYEGRIISQDLLKDVQVYEKRKEGRKKERKKEREGRETRERRERVSVSVSVSVSERVCV